MNRGFIPMDVIFVFVGYTPVRWERLWLCSLFLFFLVFDRPVMFAGIILFKKVFTWISVCLASITVYSTAV